MSSPAPRPAVALQAPVSGGSLSALSTALSYALLACGLAAIGTTLYLVTVSYSRLPYADNWIEINPVLFRGSALSPPWLWEQHNEHRLVLPKLFLAADLRLFHARQTFLLASVFTIQLLHLFLLAWSMRALGGWTGTLWRTGTGLAAFCLFCPSQWENFVWGFQVCFVLPQLFATLSFVALLMYATRSRGPDAGAWRWLLLSIVAALGATYSLANGNLVWPLLLVLALLLRLPWRSVPALAATGIASTLAYFHAYKHPEQHAGIADSLHAPFKVLKYAAAYLGSSWVAEQHRVAEVAGLTGLLLAAALIATLIFKFRRRQLFAMQLMLTMLLCAGTAFITGLGRLNFGVEQAFSSRYQTVALLFWGCLGLAALLLANSAKRSWWTAAVQLCLLAIFVRGAVLARHPIREARHHGFELNAAATALMTPVFDSSQFFWTGLVRPNYLLVAGPLLRANELAIFSDALPSQIGRALESEYRQAAADECSGAIESATELKENGWPGLRMTGWAWDRTTNKPASRIIFVQDDLIRGIGAVGDSRAALPALPGVTSRYVGFTGYVADRQTHVPVEAYAAIGADARSVCRISTVN